MKINDYGDKIRYVARICRSCEERRDLEPYFELFVSIIEEYDACVVCGKRTANESAGRLEKDPEGKYIEEIAKIECMLRSFSKKLDDDKITFCLDDEDEHKEGDLRAEVNKEVSQLINRLEQKFNMHYIQGEVWFEFEAIDDDEVDEEDIINRLGVDN